MKKIKPLCCLVLIIFIFGCFPSGKIVLTGKKYPVYNGSVKVFTDKCPFIYEEIGLVSANSDIAFQWTYLIEIMQKKAASCGANAIIIIHRERIRNIREIRGVAIRMPH